MILSPSALNLTSDIDTLGLSIPTDAYMALKSFRQTISGTSLTTVYTFTPPASFTGDCVFALELRATCYGQSGAAADKCGGRYLWTCVRRISDVLTAATGSGTQGSYWRQESGAHTPTITVSGSDILVNITQGTNVQQTWAGSLLILGLKV